MNIKSRFDWSRTIFGTVVAAIAAGLAYWVWPDGVTEKPFSSLTAHHLLRVVAVGILGLAGVAGLLGAIKDAMERPLPR